MKLSRAILMSLHSPQGKGPLTHTIQPVWMHIATSYLSPAPLNFLLYHLLLNGDGSWIRKSVPSSVTLQRLPLSLINRFSHLICEKWEEAQLSEHSSRHQSAGTVLHCAHHIQPSNSLNECPNPVSHCLFILANKGSQDVRGWIVLKEDRKWTCTFSQMLWMVLRRPLHTGGLQDASLHQFWFASCRTKFMS